MQAIILATDEQRKLSPLTDTVPAPLLPIVDRPVMGTAVELLARAGVKRILVSLCNRGGRIAAAFGSGKRWGVEIEYLTQREAWGSAGSLKWAGQLLSDTFLVLPGDAVLDLDIEAAASYHLAHGGPATVILRAPAGDAREAYRSPDGRLLDPAAAAPLATGAFIFQPSVLRHIPARAQFDCLSQLVPAIIAGGEPVYCYETRGYWNGLDSARAYQEAQQVFLYSAYAQSDPGQAAGPAARVRYPSLGGRQVAPGIWVGRNDSIHPSAKLAAPVYIGDHCWVGREAELGAGTVVGAGSVIDEEATVSGSTLFAQTYVGQLVKVEQRVVAGPTIVDPESGEAIQVVDRFLLSKVGAPAAPQTRLGRLATLLATLLILAGLSPLLLLTWLLTAIGTRGRPLARLPRVGHRTLAADGSAGPLHQFTLLNFQTRRPDGSPTPGGRWIERWGLQRLPELFNVLRGDMALVGVKPLHPEQAGQLREEWHQTRHDALAGFTGLWYIQVGSSHNVDAVIVADVYYAATRSWHGDLRLLAGTLPTWLRRRIHYPLYLAPERDYFVQSDKVGGL